MANFDWHAERTDLSNLALLDRAPESEGIDLKPVRLYRLARVRSQMARYSIDGCPHPVRSCQHSVPDRQPERADVQHAQRSITLSASLSETFHPVRVHGLFTPKQGLWDHRRSAPGETASFVAAGTGTKERERSWAMDMGDLITEIVGSGATLV